ncbi:MAG: hypothetical protein IPL26_28360 [Leptospiraceae bacterium]|nr:hypothetical protein [Leptospiraceae bacterium]
MKTKKGIIILLTVVLILSLSGSCKEDDSFERKDKQTALTFFFMGLLGLCPGGSRPNVALTVGVTSASFTSTHCFYVTTSGPATITVTTSGTAIAGIESKHPLVTSSAFVNDPTGSITGAGQNIGFLVHGGINGDTFTVMVNY